MSHSNHGGSKKSHNQEENAEMKVIKRNGKMENISFDKILRRIKKIGKDNNIKINFTSLAMRIIDQLYTKIPTTKIDELTAEQCASLSSVSPDYEILAVHVVVSNHHKNTQESFSSTMNDLYNYRDVNGAHTPLVAEEFIKIVRENAETFDKMCDYKRDYILSYFGFKTLEKSYLMHINKKIVERPQHMWLRVAIGIHGRDLENVKKTYELMSQKKFTHATPTLFNSGTPHPQLSSCFLLAMDEDSIEGIFQIISECALISKWSGGIGVSCSKIRAKSSIIRGTNGRSNGIVPMLRVFNSTCLYVDQCLVPNTIIYTNQGAKQIQFVRSGDEIYNLTGKSEKIQKVLEHSYNGKICTIKSPFFIDDLIVTPQHPVAVIRIPEDYVVPEEDIPNENDIPYSTFKERKSFTQWKNYLQNPHLEIEWIEAGDLCPHTDKIVYVSPEIDTPNQHLSVTEDDCFLYGLFLTDGEFLNHTEKCCVYLYKYNNVEKFLKTYLENHFINFEIDEEKYNSQIWNKISYQWKKSVDLPFRYSDFYNTENEKCAHFSWLQLSLTHIKSILRGIFASYTHLKIGNELFYDHSSRALIECIRFMFLRLGILVAGYHEQINNTYVIRIPKTKQVCEILDINVDDMPPTPPLNTEITINSLPYPSFNSDNKSEIYYAMNYKNYILASITSIQTTNYYGTLYDLQMEKEHNYMIHQGIVHNGGGKRNGSFAIYLEPWHADIEDFLQMRKNHGDENLKARDLFYALWIPDLFMERVKENGNWTLMCPNECPGLPDVYGEEFNKLYLKYEQEHRGRKTMKARDLWFQILDAQMETGTPYLLYKDAVNRKSNQKNIGTIKSSNLCSEITEYTDKNETAVCNLASIALPAFVKNGKYDYDELHEVAKVVTYNLNRVIDVNFYPNEKTRRSNMRHRPIGLGIQGLADVFFMMNISFQSEEARNINKNIFETIYHAAVESSCEIAQRDGAYETFEGSPASQGQFQFDLWGVDPGSERYDWTALKEKVKKYGLRNSLLLAPMPTASTSQILGYNECFEPITSNIYSRRTLAGDFVVVNKYMLADLINLGIWTKELKDNIIANNGSIQHLTEIPEDIRRKYLTVWEMSQKTLIDMAYDRAVFVCQSMSLNLWVEDPTYSILTSMHFYAHSKGLKTGIYYLRRRARHQAQQFTIKPEKALIKEDEICEMCSA